MAIFRPLFVSWTRTIRHQKIIVAPEQEAVPSPVRRYRASLPWSVGGLALAAAAGAMLTAGTISSAVDGGPEPAFAAQARQKVAGAPTPAVPAAAPAARVPAAALPERPPEGDWQVQVGAFRSSAAAEAHLLALESALPELAKLEATHQLRGPIDRVRIGGIVDEAAARMLCTRISQTGHGCFVVGPEE